MVSDLTRWEYAVNPVVSMAKEYPAGYGVAWHRHPRGQLIYASSGVMRLRALNAYWLLPPMRGVWMPPNTEHTMSTSSDVALRTLYIDTERFPSCLPTHPVGIAVSPLLRELLLRACAFSVDYPEDGFEARLLELAIQEMKISTENGINLPIGRDRRLAKLCNALIDNPGDPRPLSVLADAVGATTRTLARLFRDEIGMSFLAWRQQLRIVDAVPRLVAGDRITDVATSLGYATQSAFTVMFKRVTGKVPSDYQPR